MTSFLIGTLFEEEEKQKNKTFLTKKPKMI